MSDKNTAEVAAPVEERLSDQDKHNLDLMIMARKLAIAENSASENAYKLALFQLYQKYGMDVQRDAIDESGVIRRNSVVTK